MEGLASDFSSSQMRRTQANETLVMRAVRHVDGYVSRTITDSASRS